MVLRAWSALARQRRAAAAMAELPIASLTSLFANVNRDSKKQSKPFAPIDFCFYVDADEHKQREQLTPVTAEAAMALQAEGLLPPILLTAWQAVLGSVKEGTKTPEIRALHNDEKTVWVLAPSWEGQHIRGGLVGVHGRITGPVRVRDIDRPLASYEVVLPQRGGIGWVEADLLLKGVGAES